MEKDTKKFMKNLHVTHPLTGNKTFSPNNDIDIKAVKATIKI